MDALTGLLASKAIQGVTGAVSQAITPSQEPVEASDGGQTPSFDSFMRGVLAPSAGNKIDEEALFAALLQERITAMKGQEAGQAFSEALSKHKSGMQRNDGYVPVEEAANAALQDMQAAEVLTAEEAGSIRSEAFAAAQLDDNTEALYDGRGSADDPTIAVADMESALLAARAAIEGLGANESVADPVPEGDNVADEVPGDSESTEDTEDEDGIEVRSATDGSGEFVFKPESESNGNLVVLLPTDLANQVASLVLKDSDDNEVEKGNSKGYANGGREHFRFDKPGADYPQDLTVEVTLNSGKVIHYDIPDPSQRYD